jgi:hypothetical protein
VRVVVGSFTGQRLASLARQSPETLFISTRIRACRRRGLLASFNEKPFKLLLCLVGVAGGGLAERKDLAEAMWGDLEDGGPEDKIIDVFLSTRIRPAMARLGVRVKTEWGFGLRLQDDRIHEGPGRAVAPQPDLDSGGRAGSAGARSALPITARDTGSTRRRSNSLVKACVGAA